jgi:hypothetical protein
MLPRAAPKSEWIPAFAGMTREAGFRGEIVGEHEAAEAWFRSGPVGARPPSSRAERGAWGLGGRADAAAKGGGSATREGLKSLATQNVPDGT